VETVTRNKNKKIRFFKGFNKVEKKLLSCKNVKQLLKKKKRKGSEWRKKTSPL
jgi:hypothetical protein